jgi:hypothetical protein
LSKNQYKGNPIELNNIREFENDYSPEKVLWWYTRESFFYKTLNAVLRQLDIHKIFLFRAFISDIHHQLEKIPTSADYERALSFLEMSDASDELEQVLFEIDADPKMTKITSFANISIFSDFSDEAEVLLESMSFNF